MKVHREMIVEAGLVLLQQVGLEQLTLRRLAADLGIQAPTLYWHFKSKQDLIDAMATRILGAGVPELLPKRRTTEWMVWMNAYGHGLRALLLRYRDGARVVEGSRLLDTVYLEATERIARVLVDSGFSLREAAVLFSTVYTFTVSFVTEEQAVYPQPGMRSEAYDLTRRKEWLDPKRFPLMRQAGAILLDRFDSRYNESLRLILRGAAGCE